MTRLTDAAPAYHLSRHALERLLERSARDPSWLLDVLEHKQFAYLRFGRPTRKNYALIYDALEQAYVVAILGVVRQRVVTVLTAAQYEAVHGPIAPVLYQLAQLARVQEPLLAEPVSRSRRPVALPEGPLDTPGSAEERAAYLVHLRFADGRGIREAQRYLPDTARRSWVLQALLASLEHGTAPCRLPLEVTEQVRLLAQSPKFHAWLLRTVRKKKEVLSRLAAVYVQPKLPGVARSDVTVCLAACLASAPSQG